MLRNLWLKTFIFVFRVISSYRNSYVETRGKVLDLYSNKIFCGWDYSISAPKTAVIQSASIHKELEELLAEERQHVPLDRFAKCSLIIMQLAVTAIVVFIICGIGALVWKLLDHYDIGTPESMSVMIVPTVITVIIHIFPAVISYLVSISKLLYLYIYRKISDYIPTIICRKRYTFIGY